MSSSSLRTFQIVLFFILLANTVSLKQDWLTYVVLFLALVVYVIRLKEIPKGGSNAALLPVLVTIALIVVFFLVYKSRMP
jgi:hypothetical protein